MTTAEYLLPVEHAQDVHNKIELEIINDKFYCNAPLLFSSPIKLNCVPGDTSVFAAIVPEAATPGNPIPGKVVSPHANKPSIGVFGPGNSQTSFPFEGAGP